MGINYLGNKIHIRRGTSIIILSWYYNYIQKPSNEESKDTHNKISQRDGKPQRMTTKFQLGIKSGDFPFILLFFAENHCAIQVWIILLLSYQKKKVIHLLKNWPRKNWSKIGFHSDFTFCYSSFQSWAWFKCQSKCY